MASLSVAFTALRRVGCATALLAVALGMTAPGAFAAASVGGKTIVIDPGHGGKDPGSTANGYQEKAVTLAIGTQLAAILGGQGAKVVMTRGTDVNPAPNGTVDDDLQARVNVAQQAHADVFISIHANEAADPNVSGATTFFGPSCGFYSGAKLSVTDVGRSYSLAKRVEASVVARTQEHDNGSQDMAFWVLGNPGMASILVETAFLSNRAEAAKLMDPAYQKVMAGAIGDGLNAYFASGDASGSPAPPDHAIAGCGNTPVKQDSQPSTQPQPQPVEQWVQTFVTAPLMSGPDGNAKQFGMLPPFTYLKVLGQSGGFFNVLNPATNGPGFVDAKKVGPSGPPPPPPPPSQPTWVETFKATTLWSGDGPGAVSFGPLPAWSFLQVLAPSSSPRFFVRIDATGKVAYVDRADVGPSGPPPGAPKPAPAPAAPAPAPAASAPAPASPPAAPAPAAPPPPSPKAAFGSTVVVAPGDTLYAISTRTGTSVADLISANNLDADGDIQIGQKLTLPGASAPPAAAALAAPVATAPAPKPPAPPAAAGPASITVAPGDTLSAIAARYGASLDSLVKLNHLDSPDDLQAGQTLKVAAA